MQARVLTQLVLYLPIRPINITLLTLIVLSFPTDERWKEDSEADAAVRVPISDWMRSATRGIGRERSWHNAVIGTFRIRVYTYNKSGATLTRVTSQSRLCVQSGEAGCASGFVNIFLRAGQAKPFT